MGRTRSILQPSLLLLPIGIALAASLARAQDGAEAYPDPPYVCAHMTPGRYLELDAPVLYDDVPAAGPILIAHYWSDRNREGFTAMRMTVEETLAEITVTVRDAEGNSVAGESGDVVGGFLPWLPAEELAAGAYTIELSGPERIVLGDCYVAFTPAEISINVGDSSVEGWTDAAELTLTDLGETRLWTAVNCCTVAPGQCTEGVDCAQCWDAITGPAFQAEWGGEGLYWLSMDIEPATQGFTELGNGTNTTFAQYMFSEFGELCVEGSVGPLSEAPTRTIERCITIASAEPLEIEGRTRVDVESCEQAPDVQEGTRGLLVLRAATEAEARSLVESSDFVPGEGFVIMDAEEGTEDISAEQDSAEQDSGADPGGDEAGPARGEGDETEAAEQMQGFAEGEAENDERATTASTSQARTSSGCGMSRGATSAGLAWLLVLLAVAARRRNF